MILVIFIAGCLVGTDTGLHLRRLIDQTRARGDHWFPHLAALAPLITGIAIAQSILLALLTRWPELAYVISGEAASHSHHASSVGRPSGSKGLPRGLDRG